MLDNRAAVGWRQSRAAYGALTTKDREAAAIAFWGTAAAAFFSRRDPWVLLSLCFYLYFQFLGALPAAEMPASLIFTQP
jgi:hypothetical protein